MIYLTEMLGLRVVDSAGRPIGRVQEVALTPSVDGRRVSLFIIKQGKRRLEIPPEQVADLSFSDSVGLRLNVASDTLIPGVGDTDTGHLLIGKDLLDQQIIDVNGRKVVRVNDVHFE